MKKVICLLLCLILALSCVGCGGDGDETTGGTTSGTAAYTIEIRNQADTPLANVGVYIYTDETREDLVWFARTDDTGTVSFTGSAAEDFAVVLDGVPAGYKMEESYTTTGETTRIVLQADMADVGNLTGVTYYKGDVMGDFSVTAPDGTEYTLSELLAEKKIVVLNFWYLECQPCKSEFPYLQKAYELYGDQIAILAMNPVNTEESEIAAFRSDNGITFPMVKCDSVWESAMQLTAYPTTVVIDSYGTIRAVHTGAFSDTESFVRLLADYILVDDAVQTDPTEPDPTEEPTTVPVEDPTTAPTTEPTGKEETPTTAPTLPTEPEGISPEEAAELMKDNPTETAPPSFDLVVVPGYEAEVNVYKIAAKMELTISDKDAYVIYNGRTYKPNSKGVVSVTISASMPGSPIKIKVGNTGSSTKTFTVNFILPEGSWGNPYSMKVNEEFKVSIAAGNDQGVYYSYTATESGTLTLECLKATDGVSYSYEIQLQSTTATKLYTLEEGASSITIEVNKGDQFMIHIGTYSDDNSYPAGEFTFLATFTKS